MANEKVIVSPGGPGDSEQDFTVSLLSVGTEQVNAVVGTNDVAIVVGSAVDVENTGEVEELVRKLIQYWREEQFRTS